MSSIQQRTEPVQQHLRELVRMHNDGTYPEGPEALNAEITRVLTDNKFWEDRVVQVAIGVYPPNRENTGLVSYDVQGLLHETFHQNGRNPAKWDCSALKILEEWNKSWFEQNQKLVTDSNGLLPPVFDMELASGVGSHGVAALRSCKFPTMFAFPEIANQAGEISMHKIIEKQPSMKKPLEEGILIKVLHGEVEKPSQGYSKWSQGSPM